MVLNVPKCEFGNTELIFLGHLVSSKGSQPCSEKIEAILDFPLPVTVADLRRFLGLVNFYRRWLPQAASAQAPLFDYTADSKKNDQRVIDWSPEAKQAFETTKSHLAKATLLVHPSPDAETRLVTDASDFAIGATLEQLFKEDWKPLHFLEGRDFKVVSDHKPLIYAFIQKSDKASPRQRRQLCFISQFTTAIEYLPGLSNVVADALSRVEVIRLPLELELPELAKEQQQDSELSELLKSPAHSLNLKPIELGHSHTSLYCDLTETLPLGVKVVSISSNQKSPDMSKTSLYNSSLQMIGFAMSTWTWWVEAVPLKDISTASVLRAFQESWVARFGAPRFLTTDQGSQFESQLFQAYLSFLGCQRIRTVAYYPAANGMIERWHRSFKVAVMCHNNADWVKLLPTVLLGLRTAVRSDTETLPLGVKVVSIASNQKSPDMSKTSLYNSSLQMIGFAMSTWTWWVEAVPLKDISTASVLRAFQESWVARFGAPRFLTTDQGSQFESQLFQAYLSFLGCQRIRTVAYYPAANGMIERWHRSFKVAVMCHNNADWVKLLPTVLLGLRTAVRSDTGASPAGFLYGTNIRVPGEFFFPVISLLILRSSSRTTKTAVRKPLERPYTGTYKVLERISDQDYKIDYRGTPRVVPTELLKPAHFVPDDLVTPALTKSPQKVQVSTLPIPILKTYSNKKKVTFDTSVK
ncbi:uncharacterized protein LOC111643797 [Copidosoma floridanum]|uniref:uncharacterized protein LOC111643797 n=1 Tax=Copidosoma floridanum TaxID=29053 RepID=UPI000C6F4D87|nr:uncharacterized protein LOC111643797 [Copidosoma floridanum]